MEQDEPDIIDIAGPSTTNLRAESPFLLAVKEEKVCYSLELLFCSFANNLNPSESVSFAKKSSFFKAVQRNTKSRIKAYSQPTV
jgi:hypothetical protein